MTAGALSSVALLCAAISAGILAFVLHNKILRRKASYDLYRVRDELVLMVARGTLDEDSPVFQYYYRRIDFILQNAPKIGFDDMLDLLSRHRQKADFDKNMALAKASAKKMLVAAESEPGEVRKIISDYYEMQKIMILTHSSFVRCLYILFVRGWLSDEVRRFIGSTNDDAIRFLRFAEEERVQFAPS